MISRRPLWLAALAALFILPACGSDSGAGGDGGTGGGTGDASVLPPPGCGNGQLASTEACDDGGNVPGDGCSAICEIEDGWSCLGEQCTPAACGDGFRVGPEQCDDGNRSNGDGCSVRCSIEAGWVCVTPNFACRLAVCGDGAVEAQEQCDDGNTANADGCDADCVLEAGHHCPVPGTPCEETTCGDGVVEGLETCDDGNTDGGDGCNASCALEAGSHCPTPGQACEATTCGDGRREGLEGCDDGNTDGGDGCAPTCVAEPFFVCSEGPTSVCDKPIEFVRIAKFPAPMQQPQAAHYDPRTRSFVAYGFDADQGLQEFCLDGTETDVRETQLVARRALFGDSLDGAAYDSFRDTFLFVRQNGELIEVNRANEIVQSRLLEGVGVAGGVQVGDDQRIYVTNHQDLLGASPPQNHIVRIFERNGDGSIPTTAVETITLPFDAGNYLDNIFVIPGLGWIGYYGDIPGGDSTRAFGFRDYVSLDRPMVGFSDIPGVLFRNGERFPGNADGGEAAIDGGYFLVCSEYLDHVSNGDEEGFCQLFAQTCDNDLDCAARVPGTICKRDEAIPYCYSPAVARDDRFIVSRNSTGNALDVLLNDSFAEAICLGTPAAITSVTAGDHGGTITVSGDSLRVVYTPEAGACGFVETFDYEAQLGGGASDTGTVRVTVPCECGNSVVDPGEACDDGNTTAGDGCSAGCQLEGVCGNSVVEPGESCDDGNTSAGDGCSPVCAIEIGAG